MGTFSRLAHVYPDKLEAELEHLIKTGKHERIASFLALSFSSKSEHWSASCKMVTVLASSLDWSMLAKMSPSSLCPAAMLWTELATAVLCLFKEKLETLQSHEEAQVVALFIARLMKWEREKSSCTPPGSHSLSLQLLQTLDSLQPSFVKAKLFTSL